MLSEKIKINLLTKLHFIIWHSCWLRNGRCSKKSHLDGSAENAITLEAIKTLAAETQGIRVIDARCIGVTVVDNVAADLWSGTIEQGILRKGKKWLIMLELAYGKEKLYRDYKGKEEMTDNVAAALWNGIYEEELLRKEE